MKKKLILSLLLLVMGMFFFNSCRTDETAQEEKRTEREKIGAFARFEENLASKKLLQKEGSEYVSYHEPFMKIIQTFMDKNPDYSKKFHEQVGDVYFDLRSLTYGEANKGIVYPIMKDGKVNAALFGIINLERDWVNFSVLKNDSPEVQSILSKLQKAYDAMQLSKGREQMHEEAIEEVVITIYQSIPGPSYIFYNPYADYGSSGGAGGLGGGMSGGGAIHGGGGGTPIIPPNPCEKLKTQNINEAYKAKIDALNKNSVLSQKKETGYSESKSGVFTDLPHAASTDTSDGMTITITPDTKGYIHTHLNDYEPGTVNENGEVIIKQPIRMFSPADVDALMTMAGFATNGNYNELYGTMVSSYGNYTIMFTGTASDIKTGFDSKKWQDDYIAYKKDHDGWSLERLFLTFLKDKMNVQGVELYKVKSNGTIQKKTLNSNNKVDSNDCPK